ncbi:MAG: 3-methyladenine DNA glycosylase [Verrucomicrobiota bacterium]
MTPRTFLDEAEWQAQAAAHEARVRAWTDPHQERAARGERHPVHDFLFTYYAHRPAWLRRWHPGPEVALLGPSAQEFLRHPGYRELLGPGGTPAVAVDPATLSPSRREFVAWLEALLRGMQARPAFFGCHGLHEWAMVYRQDPAEVRHQAWPLRLPAAEIARVVETGGVTCSHFDAFRFFTPPARPLNRLQPTRETTPTLEQRGCLHANMDLYKWSFKLAPFTPAELTADCFALAREIREVDMRASPYDFQALGYAPIAIETADGRAEYEAHQRAFCARAEPLRSRLRALCTRLLESVSAPGQTAGSPVAA